VKATTKNTFANDVLNEKKVVLLDVWATWCGPCRGMMPTVEAISEETKDWAEVIKLEANEDSETLVSQLGVMGLPTFLIFKDGKAVDTIVGAVPKQVLLGAMQKAK
jgi:thioredoxin 1